MAAPPVPETGVSFPRPPSLPPSLSLSLSLCVYVCSLWRYFELHKGLAAAQVVEHLPSKCKDLSSNPVLPKKLINKIK
jgi:hypothetical protein